eukprot:CAMPEP_0182807178 /NCGR_PEP_ID=MMETSP0006_2-20121128/5995_1 /TAXON_ID=97485 /ORGANISM="Prymnesium parvum, Strain Texoma1" /LENGTH=108 /DNA_ID=CAMNT_0024932845 /DNA_START=373 /DNA_END=699 /DNA_ORIENTATION=+
MASTALLIAMFPRAGPGSVPIVMMDVAIPARPATPNTAYKTTLTPRNGSPARSTSSTRRARRLSSEFGSLDVASGSSAWHLGCARPREVRERPNCGKDMALIAQPEAG